MAYTPVATDTSRPVDTDIAETAQLEFRTMKAFYRGTLSRSGAQLTFGNTAAVSTIIDTIVPASSLLTNRKLKVHITGYLVNATGGAQTSTLNFSFGGTNFFGNTVSAPANGTYGFRAIAEVQNLGLTNAQVTFSKLESYNTNSNTGGQSILAGYPFSKFGTGLAIDTTVDQHLLVTSTLSAASVNLAVFFNQFNLEFA